MQAMNPFLVKFGTRGEVAAFGHRRRSWIRRRRWLTSAIGRVQGWFGRPRRWSPSTNDDSACGFPPAYRRFLLRFGGCCGDARCPLQELAPYEDPVDIDSFLGFLPSACDFGDIRRETECLRRWA